MSLECRIMLYSRYKYTGEIIAYEVEVIVHTFCRIDSDHCYLSLTVRVLFGVVIELPVLVTELRSSVTFTTMIEILAAYSWGFTQERESTFDPNTSPLFDGVSWGKDLKK